MANKYPKLESFGLTISASNAVVSYDKAAKLWGVSKASQGKRRTEWTEQDSQLWNQLVRKGVAEDCFLSIYYLSAEGVFFVRPSRVSPHMVRNGYKVCVFSRTVAGKEDGEQVQLRVYSRVAQGVADCLTIALWSVDPWRSRTDDGDEFKILCDFPLIVTQDRDGAYDDWMERLGFKVDRRSNSDPYADEFGETTYDHGGVEYEKNGVYIQIGS